MITKWTCNPDPAAVPTGPQADLQHLVQDTHQCSWLLPPSLPVDKPPPAVGTVPALQGTNVLLLLGDRTGQTTEFKRTRESRGPAGLPILLHPAASLSSEACSNGSYKKVDVWFRLRSRLFCLLFSVAFLRAIATIYLFSPQVFIEPLLYARQFAKC